MDESHFQEICLTGLAVRLMAPVHFDELRDQEARRRIENLTHGHGNNSDYFVD